MAGDTPSDEVVRKRAYELWDARGRAHGSDQADWEQAKAMLASEGAAGPSRVEHPSSPVQVLTDGIFGVTSAALEAATHMMEGLFGAASPKTAAQSAPATPGETSGGDETRVAAERRLQVEAEARVQRSALDAAGTRPPDQT